MRIHAPSVGNGVVPIDLKRTVDLAGRDERESAFRQCRGGRIVLANQCVLRR
jgi:hypothetical protein